MGINYNGIIFSDPIPLMNWSPTVRAGLYAILIPNPAEDHSAFSFSIG